jgi:predicted nucleic acid-binding protein
MTIVVDANILFSALITPNGKLAKLLCYPASTHKLISCHLLLAELLNHQQKIIRSAKRPANEVTEDMAFLLRQIAIYDETFIQQRYWEQAEKLTNGVDYFDTPYVALALQKGAMLWTGDKKLSIHLKSMGFANVTNTTELYELLNIS